MCEALKKNGAQCTRKKDLCNTHKNMLEKLGPHAYYLKQLIYTQANEKQYILYNVLHLLNSISDWKEKKEYINGYNNIVLWLLCKHENEKNCLFFF